MTADDKQLLADADEIRRAEQRLYNTVKNPLSKAITRVVQDANRAHEHGWDTQDKFTGVVKWAKGRRRGKVPPAVQELIDNESQLLREGLTSWRNEIQQYNAVERPRNAGQNPVIDLDTQPSIPRFSPDEILLANQPGNSGGRRIKKLAPSLPAGIPPAAYSQAQHFDGFAPHAQPSAPQAVYSQGIPPDPYSQAQHFDEFAPYAQPSAPQAVYPEVHPNDQSAWGGHNQPLSENIFQDDGMDDFATFDKELDDILSAPYDENTYHDGGMYDFSTDGRSLDDMLSADLNELFPNY
jgi:hypothetical protein